MQYLQHSGLKDVPDPSVRVSEATPPVTEPVIGEPVTPGQTRQRINPTSQSWFLDIYLAALLITTFAADQITKGWVRGNIAPGDSIPPDGPLRITHTFNTGSAFGLFPNQTTLLMLASVVAICILLLFLRNSHIPSVWLRTCLGLQLGGAAGNLVDRITLGKVTDFIDIGAWPVFNLADSSIVVGLVILAWFLLHSPKQVSEAVHKVEELPIQDNVCTHPPPSNEDSCPEGHR